MIFSTIVVLQSVFSFVLQAFAYPWIAKYLSIPNMATIGMAIQFVSYILMGAISNVYGNVTASFVLWLGFCFASPTSASILTVMILGIDVTNRPQSILSIKALFFLGTISATRPPLLFLL